MTTISKFKLFWAWQDEKEETWLHEMAKEGLHLQAMGLPGSYIFEVGEPRDDYYRMDFITDRKDYQNYLQLFKDAGWEHIGEMGGWQYFRTQGKGNAIPEIYTDKDSKAQKYQRLITILVVFLPIFITITTRPVDSSSRFAELYNAGKLIGAIFMMFYVYAMVSILRRITALKKK
jgi:ABC-type transport system substrate-binding protein